MNAILRPYKKQDATILIELYNQIIEDGTSFQTEHKIPPLKAEEFFSNKDAVYTQLYGDTIVGYYSITPNGDGRNSHICNTTYVVDKNNRGKGFGKQQVLDSFVKCKELGYKVLQFNGVVSINTNALKLYRSVGMVEVGTIENYFRLNDGSFCDGIMFTKQL